MTTLLEMLEEGKLKCLPLNENKLPIHRNWGVALKSLRELPNAHRRAFKFGIGTNSFPIGFSIIDVDIDKKTLNKDASKLTSTPKIMYDTLKELSEKTLVVHSQSRRGNIHIYVLNDLREFKHSAMKNSQLGIDIYSSTEGEGNGRYIQATLDHLNDIHTITHIGNLEKLLTQLGCQKTQKLEPTKEEALLKLANSLRNTPPIIEIERALDCLPNLPTTTYDYARDIGMAVHNGTDGSQSGFNLYLKWVKKWSGYNRNDECKVLHLWNNITPAQDRDRAITVGTLFQQASELGGYTPLKQRDGLTVYRAPVLPNIPDFLEIISRIDTITTLPTSLTLYTAIAAISGLIGRCFRTIVEGEEDLGSIGFMAIVGAPSGYGKDKCLNAFRRPILTYRRVLDDKFHLALDDHKILLKQYNKDRDKQLLSGSQHGSKAPKLP